MSKTIILAAGGTGGHIFPAQALAEVLLARGFNPVLVTDHRFHQYHKRDGGVFDTIPIYTIHAASPSGSMFKRMQGLVLLARGTVEAFFRLRKLKPLAVVGFGGYPSFPTLVAALLRRELVILHEQNSVLGKVNRALAKRVRVIAASYERMQLLPQDVKVVATGNPVRAAIEQLSGLPYPAPQAGDMLRVLVTGGSQGASVFSSVVPAALALLAPELRSRIRIDQQCRVSELEIARAAYAALGLQPDLAPFFTDMPARLTAAHLVIARAGASTVAELMIAGRPALLVPLPTAADNHQHYNAVAIEDAGAGWVIAERDFTPELLAKRLEMLLAAPQRLSECAGAMRALATPKSAEKLAELVISVASEA